MRWQEYIHTALSISLNIIHLAYHQYPCLIIDLSMVVVIQRFPEKVDGGDDTFVGDSLLSWAFPHYQAHTLNRSKYNLCTCHHNRLLHVKSLRPVRYWFADILLGIMYVCMACTGTVVGGEVSRPGKGRGWYPLRIRVQI